MWFRKVAFNTCDVTVPAAAAPIVEGAIRRANDLRNIVTVNLKVHTNRYNELIGRIIGGISATPAAAAAAAAVADAPKVDDSDAASMIDAPDDDDASEAEGDKAAEASSVDDVKRVQEIVDGFVLVNINEEDRGVEEVTEGFVLVNVSDPRGSDGEGFEEFDVSDGSPGGSGRRVVRARRSAARGGDGSGSGSGSPA
jgi:hypothetical protein